MNDAPDHRKERLWFGFFLQKMRIREDDGYP